MDAQEWLKKGNESAQRGRYQEALEAYDKAVEIDPQYVASWHGKGVALERLKRYQEALEAYGKAVEIDPQYVASWHGKGVVLEKLEKHRQAIEAFRKAVDLTPLDAIAHSNLGESLLAVGDIEGASKEVQKALDLSKDFSEAASLQGKIYIERCDYEAARESFEKAISLSPGDLNLLLWDAYAHYLETEFSLGPANKGYQEGIAAVIRTLERVGELSSEESGTVRKHTLYFLGCFYYKAKDMFSAKERLDECVKLCAKLESEVYKPSLIKASVQESLDHGWSHQIRSSFWHWWLTSPMYRWCRMARSRMKKPSSTKAAAQELLDYIWSYQIRPSLWRWWLDSPVRRWHRRVRFAVLVGILCALLVVHPFLPLWYPSLSINWELYTLSIIFLLVFLFLPIIERIKAKDYELELHPPPSFESVLSPGEMEKKMKEIETEPLRPK